MDTDFLVLGHAILFAIAFAASFLWLYGDGKNDPAEEHLIIGLFFTTVFTLPFFAVFALVYWLFRWLATLS